MIVVFAFTQISFAQCSGTPTAGIITAPYDTLCDGQGTILTLAGNTSGSGITFGWEQSADDINWVTVIGGSGATTSAYTTAALNSSLYYRSIVTCTNSSSSDTTPSLRIVVPEIFMTYNDTACSAQMFMLMADGNGTVYWFDSATGGNQLTTGMMYMTPTLSQTTTYYAEDHTVSPVQRVGALNDSIGAGANYNNAQYQIFTAMQPFTILTVKVYAQGTANRTFRLRDGGGNTLHDTIINVAAGTQIVHVNIQVPAAGTYQLGCTANSNLYRNSAGGAYPYTLPGVCSITSNTANDPARWYMVYDWHVQAGDCVSPRVPVTAVVGSGVTPTVSPLGPISICTGDSIMLTASAPGPWTWNNNNLDTTQSIYVSVAGNYAFSIYDSVCATTLTSSAVSVTTFVAPVASFTYTALGQTLSFTDASSNAIGWDWDFGDGNTDTQQNPSNTYANGLSQTVTLIATNGICNDTDVQIVCVPYTSVSPVGPINICEGNSVTLTANNGTSWLWNTADSTQSITVDTSGSYTVGVSDANCGPYTSNAIAVIVHPVPVAGFNSQVTADTVAVSDGSVNATSWTWTFGDGGSSNLQNPSHTYSANGTYLVTLVACNGSCCDTSTLSIVINYNGVNTVSFNANLILYPNPTNGLLTIKNYIPKSGDILRLSDLVGRIVFEQVVDSKNEFNIAELPKGVYFTQLSTTNGIQFGKVVKE